jgi:hypothetical protein
LEREYKDFELDYSGIEKSRFEFGALDFRNQVQLGIEE